jgi:hypothetical protein
MEDINVAKKGERVLRNVILAVETTFHHCNLDVQPIFDGSRTLFLEIIIKCLLPL